VNRARSRTAEIRRQPDDVGLLDLRMLGIDGLMLCRQLKHLRPGILKRRD